MLARGDLFNTKLDLLEIKVKLILLRNAKTLNNFLDNFYLFFTYQSSLYFISVFQNRNFKVKINKENILKYLIFFKW